MDRLEHALAQARRSQQPLALLFVDLDGLKAINGSHGRAAGDAVLVALEKPIAFGELLGAADRAMYEAKFATPEEPARRA